MRINLGLAPDLRRDFLINRRRIACAEQHPEVLAGRDGQVDHCALQK